MEVGKIVRFTREFLDKAYGINEPNTHKQYAESRRFVVASVKDDIARVARIDQPRTRVVEYHVSFLEEAN